MNLFKEDPKIFFQLVAAMVTVGLSIVFVYYFQSVSTLRTQPDITPTEEEKIKVQQSIYNSFGVLYIEMDSPSYAKSNFDVNPSGKFNIYVNEKVDEDSIKSVLSIKSILDGTEIPFEVELIDRTDSFNGDYLWPWQKLWRQRVEVTIGQELEPSQEYEIMVGKGLMSVDAVYITRNSYSFRFMTAANPGILSDNISEQGTIVSGTNLRVTFTSPMDTEELNSKVSIEPLNETIQLESNDKIMEITNILDAGTSYTITIPANTKDIYGRELGEDYIVDISVL